MSSPSDQNNGFFKDYALVSGVCIREQAHDSPPISYNPKLSKPPEYSQEQLSDTSAVKARSFTDLDFVDYAEKLQRAGAAIANANPDLVLVPMCGGVRPWQHLRIYCNIAVEASCLFPFTDKEKYSAETYALIANALALHQGRQHLSIVCIDAAEGGQGSTQLLNILEELHQFDSQSLWDVTLCLFVPKDRQHAGWKHAHEGRKIKNFRVKANLFGVAQVIGEDLDGAIISPANFGPVQQIKIRVEGMEYLIETRELPGVIDQRIVEASHYILLTEPYSTVIDIHNWKAKDQPFSANSLP